MSDVDQLMKIESVTVEPKYKKENGLWVLDVDSLASSLDFTVTATALVSIPAKQLGGNHKHPRIEAFLALGGPLQLCWLDEDGQRQELTMEEFTLYSIPSFVPHVVMNRSDSSPGFLLEFADGPQRDVEPVEVIEVKS